MDAVMVLTAVATRLGDRAGLVVFDKDVRAGVAPSHGREQLVRVTEAMYDIDAALVESDYRGAFAQDAHPVPASGPAGALQRAVGAGGGGDAAPGPALGFRHHLVIVASVADPEVDGWARAVRVDAGTSYRKAAAVKALSDRARTVARFRRLGATVVDAEPGRLAPLLADAYLDLQGDRPTLKGGLFNPGWHVTPN